MKIDLLTIFPDFFHGPLDYGILRRARETGLVEVAIHDLREFTRDKHRTVDDRPFGGGEGMVLKPEPIFECIEKLEVVPRPQRDEAKQSVILLSAQGQRFNQALAAELAAMDQIVLICGRYEGVDERVSEQLADREISIGDYVLSGGELGAAVIVTQSLGCSPVPSTRTRRGGIVHSRFCSRRCRPSSTCGSGGCWTIRTTRVPQNFAG
jgi:tRNA (guanine37-N1)-methyltransferase